MILDIGCRSNKRADIGIDIVILRTVDVTASATHLPFRSNVFERAVSYECIGYDSGPDDVISALNEGLRVAVTVDIYMWNEPMMLKELLDVPHETKKGAYLPLWYQEEADIDRDFFCRFRYVR